MNNFPNLFKPIRIGNLELPNRIVHVPTDISSSHADGSVSERDIIHHAEIAKGGTGFIIVGATSPDGKTGRPTVTSLVADGDNYIPGLARLAEAMHRYGAKCAVQLQHPGRQAAIPRYNTMSTNDMVIKVPWSAGHEVVYANAEEKGKEARAMTVEEVLDMIELFSEAAWRVQQAGFDAVELHAAHGYLLAQFMSPYTNRRNDRFGGSLENRMRFPLAIIDQIHKKCGRDFPVLVRFSVDEWIPGGRDLEESKIVARMFEEAGVAALDLSQCITETPGAGFDPMYYQQGWTMYASEAIKKVVSIPVINSHTLRDPEYCEQILAEGKTDLVGLSRQLLADPYWPVKAKLGKVREIRKCISCLVGCWQESMLAKKEIRCAINPAVGDARYARMQKAKQTMNIAVVGGGPAGMEAARVATIRGHKVTIFEKTGELGGAILGCCLVPGKEKMKWYADWIRYQIKSLGVEVRYRTQPTVDDLRAYDVIVNATGASSYLPDLPRANGSNVVRFEEVMACPKRTCEYNPGDRQMARVGERVILWGDHFQAVDTAQFLASIGKQVTIITPNKELGSTIEPVHMYVVRKRFNQTDAEALTSKPYRYPVKVITSATLLEIREDAVVIMDREFNRTIIPADTVVICQVKPNDALFHELLAAGLKVVNVGDAVRPRNLKAAVSEGANFGLMVDGDTLFNPNGALMDDIPLDVRLELSR
ncbi:FAD-dependent oxidoreductase [Neomoorella humiferrea]|uniref:NADH oxidase n=1 Tax=Neomoorella humiferrea TaxID=676965 RepID=A0A2T0AVY6_9FIRM|nr:FAD-dependent oxidoreductase [Moorella humiferrea]PRR74875.1 NADH oxidase [Moorella humiferrea]